MQQRTSRRHRQNLAPWMALGSAACAALVAMACSPAKQICEERDTIPFEDCGTCVCRNGYWQCEVSGCGDGDLFPGDGDGTGGGDGDGTGGGDGDGTGGGDGDGDLPTVCRDGQTLIDDCKSCVCQEGEWSCIERGCDQVCEPDTELNGKCGACVCSDEGKWRCEDPDCTLELCDSPRGGGCGRNSYCFYPEGAFCGFTSGYGVCQPRPEACPDIFEPVCGCNGAPYPSSCQAAVEGVSVLIQGDCEP